LSDPGSSKEEILSLYDLYSNDIYRYAYAAFGDSSEACDVVQEVFLRAHQKIHDFRRASSPKTWLLAIARNYIIDVMRRKQRDRKHTSTQRLPELSDESAALDSAVEIQEMLARINPNYRDVIILRYIDQLSVKETALTLGWTEKKVRNTTHRALQKLREVLGGDSSL